MIVVQNYINFFETLEFENENIFKLMYNTMYTNYFQTMTKNSKEVMIFRLNGGGPEIFVYIIAKH